MFFSKLVMAGQKFEPEDPPAAERLLSAPDFREVLQVERKRSDRSGDAFALVSFSTASRAKGRRTMRHLVRTLHARLRLTDRAGWLASRHIGVILTHTSQANAWQFVKDVLSAFPSDVEPPKCKVYRYPIEDHLADDRWADGKDDRRGKHDARVPLPHELGSLPGDSIGSLFAQPMPVWKRTIDMAGAAAGLVLLAPLFCLVALLVKFSSPGPIFFRQQRTGLLGRPFAMFKFRSMVVDAEVLKQNLLDQNEQDGPAFKITHDPRVTRLGRLLRATSIDELPQLWNVLKGEMSLVGPRPLPCEEADACQTWQRRRLDVTPGITCIWQSHGGTRPKFDDWMRMDLRYINHRSLAGDLRLIWKTVTAVVSHKALKHR